MINNDEGGVSISVESVKELLRLREYIYSHYKLQPSDYSENVRCMLNYYGYNECKSRGGLMARVNEDIANIMMFEYGIRKPGTRDQGDYHIRLDYKKINGCVNIRMIKRFEKYLCELLKLREYIICNLHVNFKDYPENIQAMINYYGLYLPNSADIVTQIEIRIMIRLKVYFGILEPGQEDCFKSFGITDDYKKLWNAKKKLMEEK